MNSIQKVDVKAGSLTNSDAQSINRKALARKNNNGKKQNNKNAARSASSPVVEEMKIALQKEGLGNFIDMMA